MQTLPNTIIKSDAVVKADVELKFIHQIIADSHPGVLEEKDLAFQIWHKQGYLEAKQLLLQAKTAKQILAALHYYTVGYQDSHLGIWSHKEDEIASWAGWIMQKRADSYVVTESADNWPIAVPPVGAKVLQCNGMPIAEYIETRIAPYTDRRNLYQSWQRNAIKVTLESPIESPLWQESLSRSCLIQLSTGAQQVYPLLWQSYDEGGITTERFYTRKKYSLQVQQLAKRVFWVHISTFSLNLIESQALEKMLDAIRQLDSAQLVVLDTRGNTGGNSLVGAKILKALLKDRFVEKKSNATAHYRVSNLAVRTYKKILDLYRKVHGESSLEFRYASEQYQGMQLAQLNRKEWFEQISYDLQDEIIESGKPFNGQLVLLTDSYCVSACLDFSDMVLSLPGTIHIGLPTNADTNYLEAAQLRTPGGLSLSVPLKVWRNRLRGSNQAYIPQYLFEGDITDTPAVQQWVLDTIKYNNRY